MTNKRKITVFALLAVGVLINALTIANWNLSLISNDGTQYLSTARNWLAGNGFSTDALVYAPHFQGVLPAIQTVWPPGYSSAIALTSKLGFELEKAAFFLNLITHATAALCVWLILLKMQVERFFASVCALVFYGMALPWAYVSGGLTEPLFITLILLSLYFLPQPQKSTLPVWIACGLFLAMGILVRYSNVFAAFGTGLGIFTYTLIRGKRNLSSQLIPSCKLALLLSIPVATFGYLMYRTYEHIGTLDRYSGAKTPETLSSTARLWAVQLSELFGFSNIDPAKSNIVIVLFFTFILLAIAITTHYLFSKSSFLRASSAGKESQLNKSREQEISYLRLFTLVSLFHGLGLFFYLSSNALSSNPLTILPRYLYQIYPAFFIIFCYMLHSLFTQNNQGAYNFALKAATTFLLGAYAVAQINSIQVTRADYFQDARASAELMDLPVNESVTLKDYIQRCFAEDTAGKSLWSPHAQAVHLHTGVPTITLLSDYTKQPFNADTFHAQVTQYQIGMFVFINLYEFPNEQHEKHINSVKNWVIENGYSQVSLPSDKFANNLTVAVFNADPDCGLN